MNTCSYHKEKLGLATWLPELYCTAFGTGGAWGASAPTSLVPLYILHTNEVVCTTHNTTYYILHTRASQIVLIKM